MNDQAEFTAPVEFRLSGRTLSGVALRYGERARDRPELFEPGAFQPLGDVRLSLQHDRSGRRPVATVSEGTLRLMDTRSELRLEADLAPNSAELSLVERRTLRGLSVEFVSKSERTENGIRIVERASLPGIGLVDTGSYRTRLELREETRARMGGAWFTASIPFGKKMACKCQGPDCDEVLFEPGAFDDLDKSEVLAVGGGGFANVLGSLKRGTLLLDENKGGLQIGLTNRDTETARRITSSARVAPIYVRPLLDLDASDFVDDGRLRRFSKADVRALLVKPTVNDKGHLPATIDGVAREDREEMNRRHRRALWL